MGINFNSQSPNVNPNPNDNPAKANADDIVNKILSNPATNASAEMAYKLWDLANIMANVAGIISKASGESGIAAIKYGFNSADKSAIAGGLVATGGVVLGVTGVVQGVAGCKSATELAQATKIRSDNIAKIKENTVPTPDTIQVEAIDEPISPILEEEVFYDAEEMLSCKQANPEEKTEKPQSIENKNAQDRHTNEEANALIATENKEYNIKKKLIQEKNSKFQGIIQAGQGIQTTFQGASNFEKAKSDKDTLVQQTQQENQNKLKDTADDVKRKGDKLTEFNPFEQNGSSLRG